LEIHKPKAAHSWREFAIEIGTIICGILIALSLEQVVESLHMRHLVHEAREGLHRELAFDAGRVLNAASQDHCVDRRLALLADWAGGRRQIDSSQLDTDRNRPLLGAFRSSAWDVAKTGQAVSHMSVEEQNRLATAYELFANQQSLLQQEREAWVRLGRYAGKATLEPEEARRLREDVAAARVIAAMRRINEEPIKRAISALGVKPSGVNVVPRGRSFEDLCAPLAGVG
jgi:hypothetical protein